MKTRSLFIRVRTRCRWEYIDDHLRLTPNWKKAAIFPSSLAAMLGLRTCLREGVVCQHFEVRDSHFADVNEPAPRFVGLGRCVISGPAAVIERLMVGI
jgi:hypothetical protein